MVTIVGRWESFPATLTISMEQWSPVEVGGGRWAASDGVRHMGSYLRRDLAANECRRRNGGNTGNYVTYDKRTDKWLANVPGEGYYGRYLDKKDADEAIRLRRNLAAERKVSALVRPLRTVPQKMALGGQYRVMVAKRYYGVYQTPAEAILVRDFVHHMQGRPKWYPDYLMPLDLISNGTAVSLIDTAVTRSTEAERAEFRRRVDEINAEINFKVIPSIAVPPQEDTSDIQRVTDMDWRNA